MRLAFTALAVLFAFPAWAQMQCAPYEQVATTLTEKFGERRFWTGPDTDGLTLELWATPDGGTWTIIRLMDDETACRVSDGMTWAPGTAFVPIRGEAL